MRIDARTQAPSPPPTLDALGLESYLDAVRDSNPFSAVRVNEPSRYDVDVPSIHADSFDRLVALAARAHRDRAGVGAVLYGGAGVGKSHLLSRLFRWAIKEDRASYVFLHNIQADPERLPRYLLKCVVSLLSQGGRRPHGKTPLFRLVHDALALFLKEQNISAADWKRCEDQFARLVERSAEEWRVRDPAFNRRVHAVLFQFLRLAYPRKAADPAAERLADAALAWLSGEEIEPAAARALGLPVSGDEPVALRGDDEVEQALLALAQLAQVCGRPFVLCIDQVDNLNPEQLKALCRCLHALLDHAVNLLVVISGVKSSLLELREEVIPEAAWDRIAEYKVEPKRIGPDDARRILEARLEKFHDAFLGLGPVKRHLQEDTLFPLGRAWLAAQLGDGLEFRPRQVLMWARDAWEDQQAALARLGGPAWLDGWAKASPDPVRPEPPDKVTTKEDIEAAIDDAVDRKIEEAIAQRRLHRGSLPPDAGNLAGLVQDLLGQCRGSGFPYTFRGVERKAKVKAKLPPFDLLVREQREADGREITSGVLFVTNDGISATASLRRLLEDDDAPDHRILVTDEERKPLRMKSGSQAAAYYSDLARLGPARFEHIKLDFEQYAALDALEGVVNLARVGDLDIEIPRGTIRPVSAEEVVASHHRRDRYRRHPLLRPMLTEEPPDAEVAPPPESLDEKDVRSHIMAQLSWRLGMTAFEAAKGYLQVLPAAPIKLDEARAQIKAIAGRMHAEHLIHATPHDDDLFLQRRA
ncbi:hypothetical protein TA3x_003860 [Tundrisphaera sp. TA3]|uniref:hypothetical protein n=1 Tax=Tundrisphaera sp. TA3 TaxID=3435775 RepID=UPI003EBFF1AF